MRPVETDTHDFASLRNDGKIYVDKTMYMHRLATDKDAKLTGNTIMPAGRVVR